MFENTGGVRPPEEMEEKIALELLNKAIKTPGPIKEAIESIPEYSEDADGGYLNIPKSLTLITFGKDGVYFASKTHRAILTWTEPGSGLHTYPILELYIQQVAELQRAKSKEGFNEITGNSILETEVIAVRKCAENSLVCDLAVQMP